MKHLLKDMTFVEFGERIASRPVILLPLGSQEEQGPHAPMGDYQLTEIIAGLAAERAGAIAAPCLPFGYADFFRAVPGGIQLRAETFAMALEDMATGFLDHGLDRLIVFNGHSSNAPLIDQTLRRLRAARGVIVPALNIWQILPTALWTRHVVDAAAARGHGADPLTSVYKHLMPDRLREDLQHGPDRLPAFGLPASGVNAMLFEGASVQMPLNVDDVTGNGVMNGDASRASAALGADIVEWLVAFTARFAAHWRRCDPRDPASGPA